MGIVELKRAVDELTIEERLELADYIRQSSRADDPSWQAEIGRRLDACLKGKGHSMQELLVLHDRLCAEGR
jgi:Putative addiction module component